MKIKLTIIAVMLTTMVMPLPVLAQSRYLGNLTVNPYLQPAPNVPRHSLSNPYGNDNNSPKLYDSQGNFRGNLNGNRFDPNSIANPYGRYGSRYSQDSINNPYGAGSPYSQDSPSNPYGQGLQIYEP